MGSPKALLRYGSDTFLDTLTALFTARCSPVIVVLGAHSAEIRAAARRPATFVINPEGQIKIIEVHDNGIGRDAKELLRKVQADCTVEVDTNSDSVPWRFIGESVQVVVDDGRIRISHDGQEIAVHAETTGRKQRIVDRAHFHGVAGTARPVASGSAVEVEPALLRPLAEYEQIAGGGW